MTPAASSSSASAIEFAAVSHVLQGRTILHRISLALEPGSITALLGRSGSGKTTLLRMVNALVRPSSGEVRVSGRSVSGSSAASGSRSSAPAWEPLALRRSIGYVIQETGLFPHMTVQRNAALALELAGRPESERRARAEEVLQLAGLDPALATRLPWQLSGGQRQRVGLARAMANNPSILLLDEPFGALDPITRAEMQTTLKDLLARVAAEGSGKTVLLVTHDLPEALFLADRIIFLEAGKVVADLPAAEVRASSNPDVQAYVRAVHRSP